MLRVAAARPAPNVEYRLGDATDLEGVPSGAFDAATIAYGARNIPDLDALFAEMARSLRPGGVAVCLEIAGPAGASLGAFYGLWFDRVVPRLGASDLRRRLGLLLPTRIGERVRGARRVV